jgi:hypothetical protein
MAIGWIGDRHGSASLLATLLFVALTLVGCGGDDETDSDAASQDEAALESLLLDYAALVGRDACALWSEELLAREGGLKGCEREIGDGGVTTIRVEEVGVEGDTAEVLITVLPDDEQFRFPAVREGEPTDSYDGWRLAEFEVEEVAGGPATETAATTTETTGETTEETTGESPPQTPEQKAVAYRDCIEGRGATDVKQDEFPSVDFSGGGSRVIASFGSSEEEAEQGLATIRQRDPFFVERFGTAVLYAVGDPLADDLEIGLSCVKEIG